jgi:hypothetical protein
MNWLWTWGGSSFGYHAAGELWTYDGHHVGRFRGCEVYGPNGLYVGEVMNEDRLIINAAKKRCTRLHSASCRGIPSIHLGSDLTRLRCRRVLTTSRDQRGFDDPRHLKTGENRQCPTIDRPHRSSV